jgi:glycosyltransferase involved in cell wall biosynthesis
MKVLWLASWYPGKTHATNGDFTERQARAVSMLLPVTVLFITKDEQLSPGKTVVDKTVEGNMVVYRVYYGKSRWGGWLEKILSLRQYRRLQKKYLELIMAEEEKPAAVHVQVAMKAGIGALYLKKKYGIPYAVTEHWTGYYPQSSQSLYMQPFLYRLLNKSILKHASAFLPVSAHLGQTVNEHFVKKSFTVIPNVVDTSLFFYKGEAPAAFRFIHPSYLNYQKNPEGILQACKLAADAGAVFELLFVGRQDEGLMAMALELGLAAGTVSFIPEVSYAEVAKLVQASSALLLFSRFENLPCVVLEALCCGLPVISTNVGGLPEVIDNHNGILVQSEDVKELAVAMQQLIQQYAAYNRAAIAQKAAEQFGYEVVANQFLKVYKNMAIQT